MAAYAGMALGFSALHAFDLDAQGGHLRLLFSRSSLFSIPLIVTFLLLTGLRFAFRFPSVPTIAELIAGGETEGVEFKSTLRTNLHTGQADDKVQLAVLKTLAAFLNAGAGTLLIGVADDGTAIGFSPDAFPNEDKMSLHLVNLIRDRIGELFLPYIHLEFMEHGGCRVLSVRCERGPKPAFVKDGATQRFYVRGANSTTELIGQSVVDYTSHRFK